MSVLTALAGTVSKARAIGWAVAACLALSAAALAWGVHLGRSWQRGQQAQLDVSALGRQMSEFTAALDTAAKDQQAAQAALAEIARSTADELEKKRVAADAAARSLDRALAARPDLDAVRVGTGVLRAWNAGNAADDSGAAAGAADADPSGERTGDDAVPGAAAGSGRPAADAAAQSPGGGRAVPPVRREQRRLGKASARARADRGRAHIAGDRSNDRVGRVMKKPTKKYRWRNSATGCFTSREYAEANPETTQRCAVRPRCDRAKTAEQTRNG